MLIKLGKHTRIETKAINYLDIEETYISKKKKNEQPKFSARISIILLGANYLGGKTFNIYVPFASENEAEQFIDVVCNFINEINKTNEMNEHLQKVLDKINEIIENSLELK